MFVNGVESPREILSAYRGREGKEEMLSLHPIRNAIFYKCISLCALCSSHLRTSEMQPLKFHWMV